MLDGQWRVQKCGFVNINVPLNNWVIAYRLALIHFTCSSSRVARLTFFRQNFINEASFQVGLKNLSWPFGFFWPHLKLAGLKKCVWIFLRWNRCLSRNILLFHCFRQHNCKSFVINAISDARILILVYWRDAGFEIKLLRNHWKCVHSLHCVVQRAQTRGLHVAREGVLCGPRCFSGILKYFKFTLPRALENDAAK